MGDPFEVGVRRRVPGDHTSDLIDEAMSSARAGKRAPASKLDGEEGRKLHRRLLDWLFHERAKQAENRLQMAIDADYYDGKQWDSEDAEIVKSRGQMPLVYNEVAPMVDWMIGTERRTRVDWSVLPRTEDDVIGADCKTKVMKYVSDINKSPFARSRAFADAMKAGIGWIDDGARDDPTKDVIYSMYEDWRRVLHDSSGYDYDLDDARYVFRWRWTDDDLAMTMFPERANIVRRAIVDAGETTEADIDADWYLGEQMGPGSGSMYASGDGVFGEASRRRVKLIECQFKMPARVKIISDGPLRGLFLSDQDLVLMEAASRTRASIVERVVMRTHIAVFTESALLSVAPSVYRHNRFSLTPIWCYRRSSDRMPYGVVRRVRDVQQDINKRASKALFLLSTNQIIADENAVADKDEARFEADQADGYIEVKAGKNFKLQRDTDAATGQIQMMTLGAQTIQKSVGVNNENLGRQTNAESGEAIKARQMQGSVSTTEPFDNLRFAVQTQGEKLLSLVEQFYTEEKVIRLTQGAGKRVQWLRINQPELQTDGSFRVLNDLSAAAADFVVSEQDYAGTLRQVMFESMTEIAGRLPPELAVRFLRMAYEYSDMPNKDSIVEEIRKITGEEDPNKELTPEEAAQAEANRQAQAQALQMQNDMASEALNEQRAKTQKLLAEAQAIRAKVGDGNDGTHAALTQIQEQAAAKLEAMSQQLQEAQRKAASDTLKIRTDADTRIEIAHIEAANRERVAEIQNSATKQIDSLLTRLDDMAKSIQDVGTQAKEANSAAAAAAKQAEQVGKGAEEAQRAAADAAKAAEAATKAVEKVGKDVKDTASAAKPAEAPAATPSITVPITFSQGAIQVDAKQPAGNKTITLNAGGQKVTGTIASDKPATDKPKGTKK